MAPSPRLLRTILMHANCHRGPRTQWTHSECICRALLGYKPKTVRSPVPTILLWAPIEIWLWHPKESLLLSKNLSEGGIFRRVSSVTSFCPDVLLHQEACYKHKKSRLQHTVVPYIQNEDRSNSAHLRHSLGNTSPNFLVSNDRLPRI